MLLLRVHVRIAVLHSVADGGEGVVAVATVGSSVVTTIEMIMMSGTGIIIAPLARKSTERRPGGDGGAVVVVDGAGVGVPVR